MAREYFCAYFSYLDALEALSDAECGRLFKACLQYASMGQHDTLVGNERFIFPMLRGQIDRDCNEYESKCKQMQANATKSKQMLPKASRSTQEKGKEKDKDKDKDKGKEEGEDSPPTPSFEVSKVVSAWNAIDGITKVERIKSNSERYKSCNARITEYGLDKVLQAVNNIPLSDFLMGKKKDWKITFDWFVAPNNFPKVLEGNYTDTKQAIQSGALGYLGTAEIEAAQRLLSEYREDDWKV